MKQSAEDPAETQPVIKCRGIEFPLDKGVLTPRLQRLLKHDAYEEKEADAALRLVKQGDVVMELGGGLGFLSTLISTRTRASAIHSFEPNLAFVRYAQRVHELNGASRAQVHHAVLGPEDGETTFYLRDNPLSSSVLAEGEAGEVLAQTVPMRAAQPELDRLKPSILICDIEGAEVDLLPGLDLSAIRGLVIELHPRWIGRDGVAALFDHFHRSGLIFFPRLSQGKVAVFRRGW